MEPNTFDQLITIGLLVVGIGVGLFAVSWVWDKWKEWWDGRHCTIQAQDASDVESWNRLQAVCREVREKAEQIRDLDDAHDFLVEKLEQARGEITGQGRTISGQAKKINRQAEEIKRLSRRLRTWEECGLPLMLGVNSKYNLTVCGMSVPEILEMRRQLFAKHGYSPANEILALKKERDKLHRLTELQQGWAKELEEMARQEKQLRAQINDLNKEVEHYKAMEVEYSFHKGILTRATIMGRDVTELIPQKVFEALSLNHPAVKRLQAQINDLNKEVEHYKGLVDEQDRLDNAGKEMAEAAQSPPKSSKGQVCQKCGSNTYNVGRYKKGDRPWQCGECGEFLSLRIDAGKEMAEAASPPDYDEQVRTAVGFDPAAQGHDKTVYHVDGDPEDSPEYRVRVLGEFPKAAKDSDIPIQTVGYTGPGRRSGQERRKVNSAPLGDYERRGGKDRRGSCVFFQETQKPSSPFNDNLFTGQERRSGKDRRCFGDLNLRDSIFSMFGRRVNGDRRKS
jgi:hypothetical protein